MSGTSEIRDITNVHIQSLLNQALTDSIGFYVMFKTPMIADALLRTQDSDILNAVRLGLYTTAVDSVGSVVRNYVSNWYSKMSATSS